MRPFIFHFSFLLILSLTVGCGDGLPTRLPVSGQVLLDGKPVPDAKVTFVPVDGSRAANGTTDADGRFSALTTFSKGDGVLVGDHQVAITPLSPPPMPGDEISSPGGIGKKSNYVRPFPAKYGMPDTSGLQVTVAKGNDNDFTFEMSSQ